MTLNFNANNDYFFTLPEGKMDVKEYTVKTIMPYENFTSSNQFPYLVVNIGSGVRQDFFAPDIITIAFLTNISFTTRLQQYTNTVCFLSFAAYLR